jgi:copper chaperone CopZ
MTTPDTTPTSATYAVTGMTCGHCVASVQEEISVLPGVSDVQIELVPEGQSLVTVTATGPQDLDAIIAAVDDAGYRLVSS